MKAIRTKPETSLRPHEVHFPPCGVFVIESHHADNFRMGWTEHSFTKLIYTVEGRGRLLTAKGALLLQRGYLTMVPPGQKHRITDERPLSLYVLCWQNLALPALKEGKNRTCRSVRHAALLEIAERTLREMLYEQTARHPGWEIVLTGQALTLWGSWIRWDTGEPDVLSRWKTGPSHRRVEAYIEELRQTFYGSHNLEGAARRCELGVRRFSQIFRELTGTSWLAFVRELRISHAKHLLRATTRSIISVCFECGFEDLSNFYRAFLQATGTSPKHWRERCVSKGEN